MKNNTNIKRWLGGALIVQITLVAIVFSLNSGSQRSENRNLIIDFDAVDRVVIDDGKEQSELTREGTRWVLPELQNLPVNMRKWQIQIDKLKNQTLRWPVANTSASHERFEVGDQKFNKRLDLYRGQEKLQSVYLGASLGLKESYVRELDNTKTFTADLNAIDFPVNENNWLDKQLLRTKNITAIETPNFKIEKQVGEWVLVSESPATEIDGNPSMTKKGQAVAAGSIEDRDSDIRIVDQDKAADIVNTLGTLNVLEVASDLEWQNPIVLRVVTDHADITYLLTEKDAKHYIKRRGESAAFSITTSNYDKLVQATLDEILKKETVEEKESDEDA